MKNPEQVYETTGLTLFQVSVYDWKICTRMGKNPWEPSKVRATADRKEDMAHLTVWIHACMHA